MDESAFEGTAYSNDLEGQRAVTLRLGSDAIVAEGDGVTLRLAYTDCQIERGGANGVMWFCHNGDRSISLMSAAPGFGDALRRQAGGVLEPRIGQLQEQAQKASRRRFAVTMAVIAGVLALLIGGSVAIREAGRAAVDNLPVSIDKRMGDLAYESMSMQGRPVKDAELQKAVETIMNRLGAGTDDAFSYRVHVLDAPITNAFALPGGIIVVYTGLLGAAETPEQVAGVLAHEMSHVQRRHGMRRIAQSLGVVAALQLVFGDVSGLAAIAVNVLHESTVNSYSRDQEREADLDAAKILANAGIDPRALADFFAVLEKREPSTLRGFTWLATHPDLAERIEDIRARALERDARVVEPKPLGIDWVDVQRRVRESSDAKAGPSGGKPLATELTGSADPAARRSR